MLRSSLLSVLLALWTPTARTQKTIDNQLITTPEITCGESFIRVRLQTRNQFGGRLFIKGQSRHGECVRDYSPRWNNSDVLEMEIPFANCNSQRSRSLEPQGVTYSNTVVVQFHPVFITGVDKAFSIRCFYAEQEQEVENALDVSSLTPSELHYDMPMPSCSYTVRLNSPNGPIVRHAQVGDKIFHRWECSGESEEMYGMLVHSCYVENESGDLTEIIDDDGCATDPILMGDLEYATSLDIAHRHTQVFKYPDHPSIHFKCQIKLCAKMSDGCLGVTPPRCFHTDASRRYRRALNLTAHTTPSFDVDAPSILIVQAPDLLQPPFVETRETRLLALSPVVLANDIPSELCMTRLTLGLLVSAFFGLLVFGVSLILYVALRGYRADKCSPDM